MTGDLFAAVDRGQWQERLGPGTVVLRGRAQPWLRATISPHRPIAGGEGVNVQG
jgi:hypothetical protein